MNIHLLRFVRNNDIYIFGNNWNIEIKIIYTRIPGTKVWWMNQFVSGVNQYCIYFSKVSVSSLWICISSTFISNNDDVISMNSCQFEVWIAHWIGTFDCFFIEGRHLPCIIYRDMKHTNKAYFCCRLESCRQLVSGDNVASGRSRRWFEWR